MAFHCKNKTHHVFVLLSFNIFGEDIDSHRHFVVGKLASDLIGCRKIREQNLVNIFGKIVGMYDLKYCPAGQILIWSRGKPRSHVFVDRRRQNYTCGVYAYRFAFNSHLEVGSISFYKLFNLRVHLWCVQLVAGKRESELDLPTNLRDFSRSTHTKR